MPLVPQPATKLWRKLPGGFQWVASRPTLVLSQRPGLPAFGSRFPVRPNSGSLTSRAEKKRTSHLAGTSNREGLPSLKSALQQRPAFLKLVNPPLQSVTKKKQAKQYQYCRAHPRSVARSPLRENPPKPPPSIKNSKVGNTNLPATKPVNRPREGLRRTGGCI